MLKTLEEPPQNSQVILLVNNLNKLLPTIISRCQVINLKQALNPLNLSDQKNFYQQLTKATLKDQLALVLDNNKSKQEAINWIYNQLAFTRTQLPKMKSLTLQLQKSLKLINANVNYKSVLENLIFHYPKA